jgi:PLP dependent protein
MSIAENLAAIRTQLPPTTTLVAVSKTRPAEAVREALLAGQVHFGENYAQELRDKVDEVGAGPTWHFIGSLQRNKVKFVVGRAALIHDVDSLALAEEISKRSGERPTDILVGVNMGEAQKSGVAPSEALALCKAITALSGVRLRGMMTIPPATEDPEGAAPFFQELAALAARGRAEELPLAELSMGMSHDWHVAIRNGATIVRVGTAIFGARAPRPVAT